VGKAFSLVGKAFSLVGKAFSLVGKAFSLVGKAFPRKRKTVSASYQANAKHLKRKACRPKGEGIFNPFVSSTKDPSAFAKASADKQLTPHCYLIRSK
jgi:hypothetical protein